MLYEATESGYFCCILFILFNDLALFFWVYISGLDFSLPKPFDWLTRRSKVTSFVHRFCHLEVITVFARFVSRKWLSADYRIIFAPVNLVMFWPDVVRGDWSGLLCIILFSSYLVFFVFFWCTSLDLIFHYSSHLTGWQDAPELFPLNHRDCSHKDRVEIVFLQFFMY